MAIKFLFGSSDLSSLKAKLGVFLLRVFVGLAMAFAHGAGKIPPSEKFVGMLAEMGFPLPLVFAWSAGVAEFIGGLLLAIGLFTRPSALFIVITMSVAAFVRHAEDPFKLKELALLYLLTALFFLLVGGGPWSLDRIIAKRVRS